VTAVDPLSVSCDEFGCHVRATAPCMDRWGREVATHATRIGKARAVAEAREKSSVNPLLTPCPRDNCEEAGHACVEWEVVEVKPNGSKHYRATPCEPHPERVAKAERLVRKIEEQDAARDAARDAYNAARATIRDVEKMLGALTHSRHLPTIALAVKAMIDRPAIADAIVHAPRGVEAIGRVLAKGGATLGVVGSAPDRDVHDHLAAARRHARRVWEGGIESRDDGDRGTGELHLTCEASRLVLAIEGVSRG